MTNLGDRPLEDLQAQMARSDPRFARALDSGRPCRSREYRRGLAWLLLAVSLTLLVTGMLLPQGLVLAVGLVLASVTGELFGTRRGHARRRPRQP